MTVLPFIILSSTSANKHWLTSSHRGMPPNLRITQRHLEEVGVRRDLEVAERAIKLGECLGRTYRRLSSTVAERPRAVSFRGTVRCCGKVDVDRRRKMNRSAVEFPRARFGETVVIFSAVINAVFHAQHGCIFADRKCREGLRRNPATGACAQSTPQSALTSSRKCRGGRRCIFP